MATIGNSSWAGNDGDNISNFGSLLRVQATEDGTITAIENYLTIYSASGLYRAVIYRGTSSNPAALAYYSSSDITVTGSGVDTHTLSSPISMTSGEYLWIGVRAISNISLSYGSSAGATISDVNPFNHPVPDPCSGYSVFSDIRYSSALIYTPGGVSPTIDTIGTVRPGQSVSITTTGLGTLTTATTIGGKNILSASAPSGDGTITAADFVSGVSYPAMGTVTVAASDGTNTATKTDATLATYADHLTVTLATPFDESEFSLFSAWPPGDPPQAGEVVHFPNDGTGVVNYNLSLTDFAEGTHTFWVRRYDGIMYSFDADISASGVTASYKVQFPQFDNDFRGGLDSFPDLVFYEYFDLQEPVTGVFAGSTESVSGSISGTVSTGGATGVFAGSSESVSSSISGNVRNTGAFNGALSSVGSSISATVKNTGAFSGTLASASSSIAGNIINIGAFSGLTASVSSSITVNVQQNGSFTGATESVSSSITGTVETLGSLGVFSGMLDSVSSSVSVNVKQTGLFAGSTTSASSSISGNVRNAGSFASQTDSVGSSISVQVKNTGGFSGSLDSVQSSIAAHLTNYAQFSGQLDSVFSSLSGLVQTGEVFPDTNRIIYIQANYYHVTMPAIDYTLTIEPEQTRIIVQ